MTFVGVLQVAVEGQGAYESSIDNPKEEVPVRYAFLFEHEEEECRVASTAVMSEAQMTESYESGHTSHSSSESILQELGVTTTPLRIDSQTKYAVVWSLIVCERNQVVARGDASLYLRMPQKTRFAESVSCISRSILGAKTSGITQLGY